MSNRAETGVMGFGDDWPGVFIRGDAAAAFYFLLEEALKFIPEDRNWTIRYQLGNLLELLRSPDLTLSSGDQPVTQVMKDFNSCKI